MSETLSMKEIIDGLGCPGDFYDTFPEEVKLALSALISNNAQAILSDLTKMKLENDGVAELPINIKLNIKLSGSRVKVSGAAAFVRQYKHTSQMEELSMDFNQPEFSFGPTPNEAKPGKNEELDEDKLYNMAIDHITKVGKYQSKRRPDS